MTADIRIATDLTTHPKTRLLIRRVGERAFRALLTLWSYAANNRHDGDLSGMGDDAIAAASDWPEDRAASEWVQALADVGFLDATDTGYVLHDWVESQPWIAERQQRREHARELARMRWDKRDAQRHDAARNAARNAQRNAPNPTQPNRTPQPPLQGGAPVGGDAGTERGQPQGAHEGRGKRVRARDLVGPGGPRPEPGLTPERDQARRDALKAEPCPLCQQPLGEPLVGFDRRMRTDLSADGYPLHCNAGAICTRCDEALRKERGAA